MEKRAEESMGSSADSLKLRVEEEKKISNNIMSIRLSADGLIFKETPSNSNNPSFQYSTEKIPGVYCEGVQYYDLNGVQYINNTGMATLIDILKLLLEMGVEVQFVNVNENIKQKIKDAGLEKIINCSGKKVEKRILL
jgi:ABC-type transporter Mla MlaB component